MQPNTHADALGLKCICGCFGVQHYCPKHHGLGESENGDTSTSGGYPNPPLVKSFPFRSSLTQPGNKNVKAPSLSMSYPPTTAAGGDMESEGQSAHVPKADIHLPCPLPPSFSTFYEAAKVKKERQQANLCNNVGRNIFDPATASHHQAFTKLDSSSTKCKKSAMDKSNKDDPPTKQSKSTSQSVRQVKEEKQLEYMLMLAESTSKIHIVIDGTVPSASSAKIDRIVQSAFANLSAVKSYVGEVMVKDFEWSSENHRQAKQFKKCVYIAFSQWSDDLKLVDEGREDGDIDGSDSDISSSNETLHDSDINVKMEGSNESVSELKTDSHDPDNFADFPQPDVLKQTPILDIVRLSATNIVKLKTSAAWQPDAINPPFTDIIYAVTELSYIVNQAEIHPIKSRWTVVTVFNEARLTFFPTLQFVVDLVELQHHSAISQNGHGDFDAIFKVDFHLSPHGFKLIIVFLHCLYKLALVQRHLVSPSDFSLQIEALNFYAIPLRALLCHF
ncbi:hypothetical protein PILCRDRAFT_13508 [Piloderma croceum F 1598]|uniref:Uncharacterized protein n=1 Tax=Piloderma croceum (strain F 1598) TaxID=765440 RepID=A0A0C3BE78_PILCF|nr:hypothetical protein PILCRDRAFT_13508 [Piloderma croceum F 1598]